LQAYYDCPFLWFAAECLRVRPVLEAFSALDRGLILHDVLEQLFRDRQSRRGMPVHLEAYPLAEILEDAQHALTARLAQEPRHTNRSPFLQAIEQETLRRMLVRFVRREYELAGAQRVHPMYFEEYFGLGRRGPLRLGATVAIQGKIDRIDLADDDLRHAVVIDYKTSVANYYHADLLAGRVLQAPIYALALERVFGLPPLGVEFRGMRQADTRGVYREQMAMHEAGRRQQKADLDDAAWQTFLAQAEAAVVTAVQEMRTGEIALAPVTKRCPDECEYFALCRGDRYLLARQARVGRKETAAE
jgi:ATP-dependent helicase/DNAse subunit B